MPLSFLPNDAFPLPTLPTPKLVALGLDNKTAATVSKVYLSSALTLKETYETEYINACEALFAASDNRGYSSKELRAKLLTVSVTQYSQALSKWMEEVIQRAKASVLKKARKHIPQLKVTNTAVPPSPNRPKGHSGPQPKNDSSDAKPCPFGATSPPHAFPLAYPPLVPPAPISFVTRIPLLTRSSKREPKTASDCDIDGCIAALARLSLGSPPPSQGSRKPSKSDTKPRSHKRTNSNPKPTSPLSPSRPRLVSPTLDTSVAVPHKPLPKHTPSYPSSTNTPRSLNIDIPRSDRRKACSIPYRRPPIHPSTSPESSSSFSHSIQRTPSLISDHGSEASSPSTPPDFPPMFIHPPALIRKDFFPEAIPLFEHAPTYPSWEYDIDFGSDIYG